MASVGAKRVVLTGGGSGGHITPVLAVAAALKHQDPTVQTIYVGQSGDSLSDIASGHDAIDAAYFIHAGKLRRYHGVGWRQILDIHTMLLNIRDLFRTGVGFVQSLILLLRLRPSAVFIKGGFVGVPVGLSAALLRVPYITHDSDALPGLANRIVARWARMHAVALPKEVYRYPAAKTKTVGVPVSADYRAVDVEQQMAARHELDLRPDAPVVTVATGGLGAVRVNTAVVAIAGKLLAAEPKLIIIHQTGRAHEAEVSKAYDAHLHALDRSRVRVVGFVPNMHAYTAAADVVIARAGGTNLAELAVQGKACVVIPNPYLTGGHQLKNAEVLAAKGAVVVVKESELVAGAGALYEATIDLLRDSDRRAGLGAAFQATVATAGDAADSLAGLLLGL